MISQKAGKPSRIYDGEYPLTGILKCPICGAGMVMSRVTATRKDGSKNRMVYYCCGNWKNKGTAVCHSNMIRVEKANDFVYHRLEEIMTNDKFFQEVVSRVNREHEVLKANACKEKTIQERESDKIRNRHKRNYESYEDGLISKEEFLERKNDLNEQLEQVKQRTNETALTLITEEKKEIPVDTIRGILRDFGKILSSDIDRTVRKRLLHMLISEITIDMSRNIDSIKLKLSDELIRFLQNNGGTPTDGVPSVFLLQELGMKTLELELVI